MPIGDLRNVLNSLKSSTMDKESYNEEQDRYKKKTEEQLQIGEAVACVWQGDVWYNMIRYLRINDQIAGGKIYVTCLRKLDKQSLRWLFPDEAEIRNTSRDQVITRNIEIRYSMKADNF